MTAPLCSTFRCPEPATVQAISIQPARDLMRAPAIFHLLCNGCAERSRRYDAAHPHFNPARYERIPA